MENATSEKPQSLLETVTRDVMDDVKFSKEAELAFENYYEKPCVQNMIGIINCVTNTDFYKLRDNEQRHVAFAVGLVCKTLLDNNVDSEWRKKLNAFPNLSLISSLFFRYNEEKDKDENLRMRIVNIANCNGADEIVSYIRNELAHYIDRTFNVFWLVKDLVQAEKTATEVLKRWVLYDYLYKISGSNKKECSKED